MKYLRYLWYKLPFTSTKCFLCDAKISDVTTTSKLNFTHMYGESEEVICAKCASYFENQARIEDE